jgi:hypothetical protein
MAVEGVLCDDTDRGPFFSRPDSDGIFLYHGLSQFFSVVLSSTWTDENQVKSWLTINGITLGGANVSRVLVKDRPGTVVKVRERHLLAIRSAGTHVSWVVDDNPEVGAMALRYGVRPLICPRPTYENYSLRPDAEEHMATWAQVEAEAELQKSLRGKDLPARNDQIEDIDWTERGWG